MFELGNNLGPGGSAAVVARLAGAHDQLVYLRHRIALAQQHAPRGDASGWEGAAALAYRFSLELMLHDLDVADGLLRAAADLTSAAAHEMAANA